MENISEQCLNQDSSATYYIFKFDEIDSRTKYSDQERFNVQYIWAGGFKINLKKCEFILQCRGFQSPILWTDPRQLRPQQPNMSNASMVLSEFWVFVFWVFKSKSGNSFGRMLILHSPGEADEPSVWMLTSW